MDYFFYFNETEGKNQKIMMTTVTYLFNKRKR